MSNKSIAKQPNPLASGKGNTFLGVLSILMGIFVIVLGIVQIAAWHNNYDISFENEDFVLALPLLINTFVNGPVLVIMGISLLVRANASQYSYPLPFGPFKEISDRIHGTLYGLLCGFFIVGMIAVIILNIIGVNNTAVAYGAFSIPLPVALIFFYGRLLLEYHSKKDYLAIEEVEILKGLKGAPAPEESAPEVKEPAPAPTPTPTPEPKSAPASTPKPTPTSAPRPASKPVGTTPTPRQTETHYKPQTVLDSKAPNKPASFLSRGTQVVAKQNITLSSGEVVPAGTKGAVVIENSHGEPDVKFENGLRGRVREINLTEVK